MGGMGFFPNSDMFTCDDNCKLVTCFKTFIGAPRDCEKTRADLLEAIIERIKNRERLNN